jgi:thymidylate kinase
MSNSVIKDKEMLIQSVFSKLNTESVRYFHFKSSSHLDESFNGTTDFDIVVNINDIDILENILFSYGAKKRLSTFNAVFEGVFDYLLFEPTSGKLFHFHIHTQLIFGKKETKNFSLGGYDDVTEFITFDEQYGLYRLTYEFEFVLLILRANSKIKVYDPRVYWRWVKQGNPFGLGLNKEIAWLSQKVNFDRLAHTSVFFGEQLINQITHYLFIYQCKECSRSLYFRLIFQTLIHINNLQRVPRRISIVDGIVRGIHKRFSRRWLSKGGLCVSLVGSDGSGKTTLCQSLIQDLNYKLNAKHIYLGMPKSPLFKALQKFSSILGSLKQENLADYLNGLLYSYCALSRKRLICKGRKYANAGYIVIFERYPLKEFFSMSDPMDGPKLKLGNFLSEYEQKVYRELPDYADLNLILKAGLDTVISRKFSKAHEEEIKVVEKKVEAVNLIKPNLEQKVFIVDANVEKSLILRDVKKEVYAHL